MRIRFFFVLILILHFLTSHHLFAQSRPYEGPDDPAGDIAAKRSGWMNGNRVLVFFRNTAEQSDHIHGIFSSKWPNTLEGTKMHDGICLLIGARVYIENDSIPVTDPIAQKTRTDLDTLYYCQTSFRLLMDMDPTGTIEWGFYPVFGYFNEISETPAMSNLPESWPPEGWPATGNGKIWPGEWNGRFGRGIMKADLECFFVANDAQDQEYLGPEDKVKYYPRPGLRIGDKKADVTIQKGRPWGGLGIRVQTRGFQWSNPSAHDAIFWEYGIANISDYDLTEMYFGVMTDNAVGGECCVDPPADDIAYYNKRLNMCYAWDKDGIPVGGGKEPGIYGLAFLESPGIPGDGIDNDKDGLIDESRNNNATKKIGPYDGITNLADFLSFYYLEASDLKEHWDADEDQDWRDWNDVNGNGKFDDNENIGDDVGLDGVGPLDLNYFGPDADGTEANHRPDRIEGIAEPNFAETDVSESDMLGLTSFRYILDWGDQGYSMVNDQKIFELHYENLFDEAQMTPMNFLEHFASGLFPLYKGLTERISISELHAYETLAGLNSEKHEAPALFRLKEVVQLIYETDYRFAQPPLMPTLTANPADGKVFLSWDDKSDKFTRDAFAKNINDFEGYKVYRSTDPYIADPMSITDGYGSPTLRKPVFQCDLINDKKGFADYGEINGIQYYLGNETGIQHSFIDNTVQNGRTYYYVLVAYDYGLPGVGGGISPSENTFVLEIDENENIRRISGNVAVVTPHQLAAGYPGQDVNFDKEKNSANAKKLPFEVEIFNRDNIKKGHTYKLKFHVNELGYSQTNARYRSPYDILYLNDEILVYDVTLGDSLVYRETKRDLAGSNFDSSSTLNLMHLTSEREIVTELFEGMRLRFRMPTVFPVLDRDNSGWVVGNSPMRIQLAQVRDPRQNPFAQNWRFFPWHYEIIWTATADYKTRTDFVTTVRDQFNNFIDKKLVLLDQHFNFYIVNKSFTDSLGNHPIMDLLVYDVNGNGKFDSESDYILVGDAVPDVRTKTTRWGGTIFSLDFIDLNSAEQMPKANDVYRLDFNRGFHHIDSLLFTITGLEDELDKAQLKDDMQNIKVVPNPYVVTNTMESAVANWDRNQKRQLMFTHIPAQCTIRIFTISGVLVDEIDVDNSATNRTSIWDLNSAANGTAHWDLRSKEGLEIAAGYYIYHVQSKVTGDVKVGKFAVIK
ncbi:hypothetical protein JW964_02565 [candidate division KSB1 bacterium]|nr:hypothetical protein [candidate division KSB1 bacterium]